MIYSENIKFTKTGIVFTDKHGNKLSLTSAFRKAFYRFFNWYIDFKLFVIHFFSSYMPFWFVRKIVFQVGGVKIGKGSTIHMGAKFFDPSRVEIGVDTILGDSVFLDGRAKLKIGSHTDFASEVMVYNSEHDLSDPEFKAISEEVIIGDYVFVGPRAIILPGVKIGKGAVVAAGAVVTKDVEAGSIVAGVPAKVIGERKLKNFNYRLGRARLFQ